LDLGAVIEAAFGYQFNLVRSLVPYGLSEMANDAVGLMTGLGLERSYIVGSSMGGMIAQTVAIEHPGRVLSFTSMMASTGEADYGQSTPEAMEVLMAVPPSDRDGYVEFIQKALVWASGKYGDPTQLRELAARSYDRGYYPAGSQRQLADSLRVGPPSMDFAGFLLRRSSSTGSITLWSRPAEASVRRL
jgi:pimeloyl-ACP methyl ester carboxylesterase